MPFDNIPALDHIYLDYHTQLRYCCRTLPHPDDRLLISSNGSSMPFDNTLVLGHICLDFYTQSRYCCSKLLHPDDWLLISSNGSSMPFDNTPVLGHICLVYHTQSRYCCSNLPTPQNLFGAADSVQGRFAAIPVPADILLICSIVNRYHLQHGILAAIF